MIRKFQVLLILFVSALPLASQEIELVKNIVDESFYANFGSRPPSSDPENLTAAGEFLFFTPPEYGYPALLEGTELWLTDGTYEGTRLVKDINPGPGGSFPMELTWINGLLFFSADSNGDQSVNNNRELYVSDGTTDGTRKVKKINTSLSRDSRPHTFIDYKGVALFLAYDYYDQYFYTSDGTAKGTQKLDILPDGVLPGFGQGDRGMIYADSLIFFSANHPDHGNELWVSDGTRDGTRMLKDIYPGMNGDIPGGSGPRFFARAGDLVYFAATTPGEGNELWCTDGTEEGTYLVKDIRDNATSDKHGEPYPLGAIGDTLFFYSDATEEGNLWKSDGTEEGTQLLKGIFPDRRDNAAFLGDSLFFSGRDENNKSVLWVSDGTPEGTRQIHTPTQEAAYGLAPLYFEPWNGLVYFSARDTVHGTEIWKTDGMDEGTGIAVDVVAGLSSNPDMLTMFGDQLVFRASNNLAKPSLWISDGTENGTVPLKEITLWPSNGIVQMNGVAYFGAVETVNGPFGLWKSDGTPEGTELVREFALGNLTYLTVHKDTLYFTAYDETFGLEIWKSDGTFNGTHVAVDHTPGITGTRYLDMISAGGNLFVSAETDSTGFELFMLDSTYSRLKLVKDIFPGTSSGRPSFIEALNGVLFFQANDGVHGYELWRTDGTEEGTSMVKNIAAGLSAGLRYSFFHAHIDCELYFIGWTQEDGFEFWKSDGTSDGTVMLEGMFPDPMQAVINPISKQDHFYYTTYDPENGSVLWKSNGSPEGTVQVLGSDLLTVRNPSNRDVFEIIGETLYFTGYTRELGFELYRTTVDTFDCANDPVLVSSITELQPESCASAADAVAEILVEGGTCGYSFSLDGESYNFGSRKEEGVGIIRLEGLKAGGTTVYIRDENECMATVEVSISMQDELVITGTITKSDAESPTGSITLDVEGGTPPYNFDWSTGDTTATASGLEPGEYTVTVTDAAGCLAEETFTVDEATTGLETSHSGNLNMYPNPVTDVLNIELPADFGSGRIQIFDPYGRMVSETETSTSTAELVVGIDLGESGSSPGMYLIRMVAEDGSFRTSSFIKN